MKRIALFAAVLLSLVSAGFAQDTQMIEAGVSSYLFGGKPFGDDIASLRDEQNFILNQNNLYGVNWTKADFQSDSKSGSSLPGEGSGIWVQLNLIENGQSSWGARIEHIQGPGLDAKLTVHNTISIDSNAGERNTVNELKIDTEYYRFMPTYSHTTFLNWRYNWTNTVGLGVAELTENKSFQGYNYFYDSIFYGVILDQASNSIDTRHAVGLTTLLETKLEIRLLTDASLSLGASYNTLPSLKADYSKPHGQGFDWNPIGLSVSVKTFF